MEQGTFAELEHDTKKRRTRREAFLEKMGALLPWERLEKRIEPFYPRVATLPPLDTQPTTRTPLPGTPPAGCLKNGVGAAWERGLPAR